MQTIAAISTPPGMGAVGIVRLSGSDAVAIAGRVFRPLNTRACLSRLGGYRALLGKAYDGQQAVDEVVAFVYRATRSYTGEDVVELCCHGGVYAVRKVLRLCLDAGAQPAQPGEFTRRAFLSGKMDLSQAEAVMDLVSAQGSGAMQAALAGREGALSKSIGEAAGRLTAHCAHIAAWCDYPEEDLAPVDAPALGRSLGEILSGLEALLAGYDKGRLLREGVVVAIVGRANVGKSTLMNLLMGQERSIVTDIPGTTRDIVSERITLGGIPLNILDTAGLRQTSDPIEREGVARAQHALESADLVLAVFDGSQPLEPADRELLAQLEGRAAVALLNKSDLAQVAELPGGVRLSARTGKGREQLEQAVLTALDITDTTGAIVANERQRLCLESAAQCLRESIDALGSGVTLDAVGVCLDAALEHLLALTGQCASDAVVDEVFARFCVGK